MLASQGFEQAANAVAPDAAAQSQSGFTPFAAFGGSSMRQYSEPKRERQQRYAGAGLAGKTGQWTPDP